MGLVRTKITLKNVADEIRAKDGNIKEEEIRQATINALVDTGSWILVINEELREELGLGTLKKQVGILANGAGEEYSLAGPVEIWWKNRSVFGEALVIPSAKEVLLGALPLQGLDLVVDPFKEEVVGAHGDERVYRV